MKLLYIYDKMPGGYQEYLTNLLKELRSKIDVKVLTYDNHEKSDYKIKSFGKKDRLQRLWFKLKFSKYSSLDRKIFNDYDIIHVQHSFLFSKVQNLKPYLNNKRIKVVITLRGGDTYIKPWISRRWLGFYKSLNNEIDAFITMSKHQKMYLKKWGVDESKIHVIPISFGNKSIAKPRIVSKDEIKIISAHRMCWEKNIDSNLRTIKTLIDRGVKLKYDIFGDGPDTGQVSFLIDKYNLKACVFYNGKISNEKLKGIYANYDFLIQLSLSDALPTTVLEAQSYGVPCIVSNSGGLPEAIIHGESGFCVDSHDTNSASKYIIELYQDSDKYYDFSKKAIEYVNNNFTLSNETNKLIKLYESLYNSN